MTCITQAHMTKECLETLEHRCTWEYGSHLIAQKSYSKRSSQYVTENKITEIAPVSKFAKHDKKQKEWFKIILTSCPQLAMAFSTTAKVLVKVILVKLPHEGANWSMFWSRIKSSHAETSIAVKKEKSSNLLPQRPKRASR